MFTNFVTINQRRLLGVTLCGVASILPFLISSLVGILFMHGQNFKGALDIFIVQHFACWMLFAVIIFVGCIFQIQVNVVFQRVAQQKLFAEQTFEPMNSVTTSTTENGNPSSSDFHVSNNNSRNANKEEEVSLTPSSRHSAIDQQTSKSSSSEKP